MKDAKKVFISYGHGDYTALVDAVFDALTEAGHMPWKDDRFGRAGYEACQKRYENGIPEEKKRDITRKYENDTEEPFESGIPAGADFVDVIYDAIKASDFVLAFYTAKTVNKRFCRDERQFAYDHKDRKLIFLRLDGVEMRLGNAGSYLDMDMCWTREGTVNREWLQEKMQAILAAFNNPDKLISPSAKLERP